MILIVGLGNPGKKLAKTRHNVGFMILDSFKRKGHFSGWQTEKQFKAKTCQAKIDSQKIILAKPQTFMNNSGEAVKLLIAGRSLLVTNLFIVHDDLAFPLGEIKISKGRGTAGHKGVQSIINELGSKDFIRLRIGVNHKTYNVKQRTKSDFVLKEFTKKEEKILKKIKKRACQALVMVIREGEEKAMNQFN